MSKANKKSIKTIDQQLIHSIDQAKAIPTGPLVTSAKIFKPFYDMVKYYLERTNNAQAAREKVATLAFHFREESRARFKHDTVETFLLAHLLREVQPEKRKTHQDAMTHIMQSAKITDRFDAVQQSAAESIQRIWSAFGKGLLEGGGRDLAMSSRGGSRKVLHPIDTMSEDLWQEYREVYQLWHEQACKLTVGQRYQGGNVSVASIVFSVLVEDVYPENVDKAYNLSKGTCLRILHGALACYWEPEKLSERLNPPKPQQEPEAVAAKKGDKSPIPAPANAS